MLILPMFNVCFANCRSVWVGLIMLFFVCNGEVGFCDCVFNTGKGIYASIWWPSPSLATKVFTDQLPATRGGVGDHA